MSAEGERLLDNGYRVVLFRDGLGQYSALAVREGRSLDEAVREWREYETPAAGGVAGAAIYDGPNRNCGCGPTVDAALHATAEKVFLRQLPPHGE